MKRRDAKGSSGDVELTGMLRDLLTIVDRRFNLLENKIGAIDLSIEKTRSELRQQIEGLGMRIDDLSLHRAKYSNVEILRKEIADIRKRLEHKLRK